MKMARGAIEAILDEHPAVAAYVSGASEEERKALEWLAASGMAGTFRKYLDRAGPEVLKTFFLGLLSCDREWLESHRRELMAAGTSGVVVPELEPIEPGDAAGPDADELVRAGRASLEAGEWASVVFAGGAATRFYSEARSHLLARRVVAEHGAEPPKGLFPWTPIAGRSFLEGFLAEALEIGIRYGRMPFVVLMTSSKTRGPIERFLRDADLGGFPTGFLKVIGQAEHPRLDDEGDLVVQPDGSLLVTGDGHGGVYRALTTPDGGISVIENLRASGIKGLVLHNVDNVASRPFDAGRIGYHIRGGYSMTMTVVVRRKLAEKVGLVARNATTDRTEVIEYSVCPPELAEAVRPDGLPVFHLAHINTNLVSVDAVRTDLPRTLYTGKKVAVGDGWVESSTQEMLNQHLAGMLDPARVGVLCVSRDRYFLPTKNLTGEDSLETTTASAIQDARECLEAAGAWVGEGAVMEFEPCLGDGGDGLTRRGAAKGWRIGAGVGLHLGVRFGMDGEQPLSEGLEIEDGAVVSISVARPFGNPVCRSSTRAIRADEPSAGKVSIGRGVRIGAGRKVLVRVLGNGQFSIPDGMTVNRDIEITVGPGERISLGGE